MLKTKQIVVSSVLALCGIAIVSSTIGCGDGMDDIKAKMAARARRNAKQAEKENKDNADEGATRPAATTQAAAQLTTTIVQTVEAVPTIASTSVAEVAQSNTVEPVGELTDAQHREQVIENLGRIGAAIEAMRRDGNGSFPVLGYHNNSSSDTGLSWRVRLLPYLGYDELHKKFDFSKPYYADVNMDAAKSMPKEFQDPRNPNSGRTRIQAVSGSGTAFGSIGGRALSKKLMEEEGINRANIAVIIETTPTEAINWIEPNDLEVDLNDPAPLDLVYPSGILSIWGDGKVYELDPDLSGEDQMLAFKANERKSKRRKAFAHRAVADPVVLAEEQAAAEQQEALTTAAVIDPKLSDPTADEEDESQLIIPGDRNNDDEEVKLAQRISRSSLVFSSYESYFNNGRFGDAWSMHLASLLLSDDSLTQRFKWSESLGRPVYGLQVGYAVDGADKLDKDATIAFDILDDVDQDLPFHKDVFNALGAPGPKSLEILRGFANDGSLGPWAQVASRNLIEKINDKEKRQVRSSIADEQGNYCPSVKFYSEGTGTKYFVDLAQRDDLDLLVLVSVTTSKDDTELALSVFDVQRRKRLYESFVLRKSNVDKWKADPLSVDPVSKWLEEFQTAMKSILTPSEVPKISVQAARNRLRELIAQTSTRVSLNEFLETKFYLDLGVISGVEYEKVAAKWSEKGEANSLNARDTYLRLEGIESFLPKDWEKPIDEVKTRQVDSDD